jgi:hypothetical protein
MVFFDSLDKTKIVYPVDFKFVAICLLVIGFFNTLINKCLRAGFLLFNYVILNN